jgi:hypothetical protein
MEKIGDSGLLGEELEIAPDGEEEIGEQEEKEILSQVAEIQKKAGGAKIGVASIDSQGGINALKKVTKERGVRVCFGLRFSLATNESRGRRR